MEGKTKKKKIGRVIIIVVLVALLLFPIPIRYKDGGSVEYKAITYSVMKHKAMNTVDGEYRVGYTVDIFGIEVFDNTRIEKLY